MFEISTSVYRIDPTKVTPTKYISFFVERQEGNLLFPCLASSSTFQSEWEAIQHKGGVDMILLGDMHFATKQNDQLTETFGVPTQCSELEEPDVSRKVQHVASFPFERHELANGVLVVPTPGHRPGAVGYIVEVNEQKLMFIGDSIWHNGSHWQALSNKANRKTMIKTLGRLEQEQFDSIYCNVSASNKTCHIEFKDDHEKIDFLRDLASKL